ncbi:MAG TPA: TfuA-like protein [Thermoanaerobaculia bacterium]|jgi:hypothetical protein
MSATVVYLGPSLALDEAARLVPAGVAWHPPVRRGDLPAAVAAGARRVAIVDGEFGQSLAVSVAEIRAALARGVEVWGASSMGALRGAECEPLGMKGFGWVFRGFRDGWLAADDEVALLFNPWSGEAVTVPLVNFRWSLGLATAEGVVPPSAAPALLAVARSVRFDERTPDRLRSAAAGEPWEAHLCALLDWMAREPARCDRKRLDAVELLAALAAAGASEAEEAGS